MKDRLVEIDRTVLPLLRNLYNPICVDSNITNVAIDTYIRCFQQDPHIEHLKFYCLNDDLANGTFVVIDRDIAYADTLSDTNDELIRLLLLIDYSINHFFLGVNGRVASAIREAAKRRNIEFNFDKSALFYMLSKKEALQFNVIPPNGIELKPLTNESDIVKANSVWTSKWTDSLDFLKRLGKHNPSVGAFTKEGTSVAWVLRSSNGLISALQTDENHYGHGYGLLVTKALSKRIAEMGHNPYAAIYGWNTASRRLFEKLGYREIGSIYYMCTKRKSIDYNVNAIELIEKQEFILSKEDDYSSRNEFQQFIGKTWPEMEKTI